MTLVKFNRGGRNQGFPYAGTPYFGDVLSTFFDNHFMPELQGSTLPPVNIAENENQYTIELASPGRKKEDFQLNLENGQLTISVEVKEEGTEENRQFTRREFSHAAFSRSFTLPEEADQNSVNASYQDGILAITIGKREEVKLRKVARKIDIK